MLWTYLQGGEGAPEFLERLHANLWVSQGTLQRYRILGVHVLKQVTPRFEVFGLAGGIPFRLAGQRPANPPAHYPPRQAREKDEPERKEEEQPEWDTQLLEEEEARPKFSAAMVYPEGSSIPWKAEELALIPLEGKLSEAYRTYIKACQERRFPARSLAAFRIKRNRMRNSR